MSCFYNVARRVRQSIRANSWAEGLSRRIAEPIIRRLYDSSGLPWSINGVRCRIDPKYRAEMNPDYDSPIAKYLSNRIRPGQVCLDVGANIGAWVIQFANAVGPSGTVIAFEPNPAAREVLEKHIKLNQLDKIVRVVPAAVGSTTGQVELFASGSDGMSRIGEANPLIAATASSITVPIITLDHWCDDNRIRPDWLFIDIEGFEAHALAGARELIRTAGPALGIIIEMHPSLWRASVTDSDDIAAQFAAIGRHPLPMSGQVDVFAEYGHVILEPIDRHE